MLDGETIFESLRDELIAKSKLSQGRSETALQFSRRLHEALTHQRAFLSTRAKAWMELGDLMKEHGK